MIWPPLQRVIGARFHGLSLNPVDILKLFADHKRVDKERIATWLDQTASEARRIADIWMENRDRAFQAEMIGNARSMNNASSNNFEPEDYRQFSAASNVASFSRLEDSFETFSTVMDGRLNPDFRDNFSTKSAAVILRRNEVKQLYDKLFGPMHRQGPR